MRVEDMEIKMTDEIVKDFTNWLGFIKRMDFDEWEVKNNTEKLGYYLEYLNTYDIWVNWNYYEGDGFEWDIYDGNANKYVNNLHFKIYSARNYGQGIQDSINHALSILDEHKKTKKDGTKK